MGILASGSIQTHRSTRHVLLRAAKEDSSVKLILVSPSCRRRQINPARSAWNGTTSPPSVSLSGFLDDRADTKWGWVVYQTCYKPEFDSAWESVKSATEKTARLRVAKSDAPGVADKMDWVFVADREDLDGASREELKRRFRDWTRAENPGWNIDKESHGRGLRYSYFLQVDEPALVSIATALTRTRLRTVTDTLTSRSFGPGTLRGWPRLVRSLIVRTG